MKCKDFELRDRINPGICEYKDDKGKCTLDAKKGICAVNPEYCVTRRKMQEKQDVIQ